MAWSHSIIKNTSNTTTIRVVGAVDSTDATYNIPWSDLASLVSPDIDSGRTASRDDVYINNIEGGCAGWEYSTGRGTSSDNTIDFYWLTTASGGGDETVWIGPAHGSGSLANKSKSGKFKINSIKTKNKISWVGVTQKGAARKPASSSMGDTSDNCFRISLKTTPTASSFKGATFLITFKVDR